LSVYSLTFWFFNVYESKKNLSCSRIVATWKLTHSSYSVKHTITSLHQGWAAPGSIQEKYSNLKFSPT